MSTTRRSTPGTPLPDRSAPVAVPSAHATVNDALRSGVDSPSQSLDAGVRSAMERRLGRDFADIRIHAGPAAAGSARAIGAKAYAVGNDIVFDAGRYDPGSRDGRHLIAHELAHTMHGARAAAHLPGIAPEDSSAERWADLAADQAVAGDTRPGRSVSESFGGWGPAWAVHREVDKISKKGKVEHTGSVGASPDGKSKVGTVEVRTGEDIDIKGGGTLPNRIAIEYAGSVSADSKWLQFVWFELVTDTPKGPVRTALTVKTTSGTKPFTTDPKSPRWSVDTGVADDPFYEAGANNLRTKSSTTVFDAPGGGSVTPLAEAAYKANAGATAVTFTAHFETYLIQKNAAAYMVAWQASTAYTQAGGKTTAAAIGYSVGASDAVAALPAARKALIDANYPAFKKIK